MRPVDVLLLLCLNFCLSCKSTVDTSYFAPPEKDNKKPLTFTEYLKTQNYDIFPCHPSQALQRPEQIKSFFAEHLPRTRTTQEYMPYFSYACYMFLNRYIKCLNSPDPKEAFLAVEQDQWNITKTKPSTSLICELQRRAVDRKMPDFVKFLYHHSSEMTTSKLELARELEWGDMTDTLTCASLLVRIEDDIVQELYAARQDLKDHPDLHKDNIAQLLQIPRNMTKSQAIAFAIKETMESLKIFEKPIAELKSIKVSNGEDEINSLITHAIAVYINQGQMSSTLNQLRQILDIPNGVKGSAKKQEALITILVNELCHDMGEINHPFPLEHVQFDREYEVMSPEWIYLRHKYITAAFQTPDERFKSTTGDAKSFIRSARIAMALLPFCSRGTRDILPYLVIDPRTNQFTHESRRLELCLFDWAQKKFDKQSFKYSMQPNVFATEFLKELPVVYDQFVRFAKLDLMAAVTPVDIAGLNAHVEQLTAKPRRVRKAKVRKAVIVVDEQEVPPSEAIEEPVHVHADQPSPVPTEASVEPKISVDDEIALYNQKHQQMVADFQSKKSQKVASPVTEQEVSNFEVLPWAQLKNSPISGVEYISIEALLELYPPAKTVYDENASMGTEYLCLNSKSLRFQWILNPDIEIDASTYKFLCQSFGLLRGRSMLTFLEFRKALAALNATNVDEASMKNEGGPAKNRTVFRLNLVFKINGKFFVPPQVGVHPEHKSSGYNQTQANKVLSLNLVHPYLFVVVKR